MIGRKFLFLGVLALLAALYGCGGGGGGGSAPAAGPTLVSITVTPSTSSIAKGTNKQFSATGRYSDNSTTDVTQSAVWSSLNTSVTTISSTTGLATGKTPGDATISAVYSGHTATALLTVTPAELVSFYITPPHPSIAKGLKQQFTATGTFTDDSTQDITLSASWNSSDNSTATIVSATGLASSWNQGSTTISAIHSNQTATSLLTVTAAELVSFSITPPNPSIAKGLKQQFTATGTFTDGSILDITSSAAWNSSDPLVSTISATGLASSSIMLGTSTITAVQSGLIETTLLTVTPAVPVLLSLSPPNAMIANGQTQQFTATATLTDSNTPDVTASATWDSSDTVVATITASGLASSKVPGATTISAVYSGLTATVPLIITPASLVSLSISPSSASIAKGLTQQFTATGSFSDSSSQDVTLSAVWTSSDDLVSTISPTGLASSTGQGTTTISATNSGQTATAQLTVTQAVVTGVSVTPVNPILRLNATQQFIATRVYTDGISENVTNLVDWATSDPLIATINSGGLASPVNMGTATISAADLVSGLTGTSLVLVRAYVTLPDTGQTTCYDVNGPISCPGTGQDGAYTINPPSYTNNGDGTTTDINTELVWQQQDDGIARKWDSSVTYCQNLGLAGKSGWRLPTRRELLTILDLGVSAPMINGTYFPGTQAARYWSSDPIGPSGILDVNFATGELNQSWKDPNYGADLFVRCVSGTQLIPSIFSNNGDGTIIDYATGLMWQRCSAGQSNLNCDSGMAAKNPWDNAIGYCEGLSLAGHDDWRLPNAKELESLIFGAGSPSIDTNPVTGFPGTQSNYYWSSTSCSLSNAYIVNFSDRTSSCVEKALSFSYVRCVRGGH